MTIPYAKSNNSGIRNVSNIFDCPTGEPKILMDEMLTTELLLVSFTDCAFNQNPRDDHKHMGNTLTLHLGGIILQRLSEHVKIVL